MEYLFYTDDDGQLTPYPIECEADAEALEHAKLFEPDYKDVRVFVEIKADTGQVKSREYLFYTDDNGPVMPYSVEFETEAEALEHAKLFEPDYKDVRVFAEIKADTGEASHEP